MKVMDCMGCPHHSYVKRGKRTSGSDHRCKLADTDIYSVKICPKQVLGEGGKDELV